jgi:hypothetical protein
VTGRYSESPKLSNSEYFTLLGISDAVVGAILLANGLPMATSHTTVDIK